MSESEQPEVANNDEPFVEEAKRWALTFEGVTGSEIRDEGGDRKKKRLCFSAFAASLVFSVDDEKSKGVMQIYFSDSSRTRVDALVHVFNPLLGWFSAGLVSNFFDILGVREDAAYVQKCFGEWFMTLSREQIVKHGLSLPDSPINRFLEELAEKEVTDENDTSLDALFSFCCESTDLARAFLLATLCRRAVVKSAGRVENMSHGMVSLERLTFDWESLLRKCRVCLP